MAVRKMPNRVMLGEFYSTTVVSPQHNWTDWKERGETIDGVRYVMGYKLPSWQRPFVWTRDQKVKLIESLWLGLNIGTFTVNRDPGYQRNEFDNLLIDGQQRLKALEEYFTGDFPVFGYRWDELDRAEQRDFEFTRHFHSYITSTRDEQYLRDYYNMMNFGGTAHKESERA